MTRVITRGCSHFRPVGADDAARVAAREALAVLTERERAMFALSLLEGIETPALFGLMGFISSQVKGLEARLQEAATHGH